MCKTYEYSCEVCPSNAKYRVIKFIFLILSMFPTQTHDTLWPTNFRSKYTEHIQVVSWV